MTDLIRTAWPEPPPSTSLALDATPEVDVGLIGAGIHGSALARELSLRGVSCALVDRSGIGGGTSQWSSQLLHGGIRYLLTGDIGQMREGLFERSTWASIAPHRVRWGSFWMPHRGIVEGVAHRIGIGLYDWWGSNRPGWPLELKLGRVPGAVFEADPRSAGGGFRGAVAYSDLLTADRDLTRDLAASSRALDLSFHDVEGFEDTGTELRAAKLRDRRDGRTRLLKAKRWVFALGPWHDQAMRHWFGIEERRLRLSAGIHVWFDGKEPSLQGVLHPWALLRPKGRILFVIPRDGRIQVGTTERELLEEEGGATVVQPAEREELFAALEEASPRIPWRQLPVVGEETGVRPLVLSRRQGGRNTSRLSREALLEPSERFTNATYVLGGKLTTARALMAKLATSMTGDACPESATTRLVRWDAPREALAPDPLQPLLEEARAGT